MIQLVTALWPGLAAAIVLGLLVGLLTGLPRDRISWTVTAILLALLAVLGGLAYAQSIPGDAGLRIEIVALLLAAYLAGCVLGGIGRTLRGSDR